MSAPVEFEVTFPDWKAVVDLLLSSQTGRMLADLPVPEYVVWEWYARGWTAREVAHRLADRAAKVKQVTVVRFYTDKPRRVL